MPKQNTCNKLLLGIIALIFALNLKAAMVNNLPVTVFQPDGTKLELLASGDEYHNWLHDKNNYTIIRHPESGYLCYAEQDRENVKASNLIVGKDDPFRSALKPGINISEEAYKELRSSKFWMPAERDAPTTGTINNIVIFIRFSGESEFGQGISVYDGWFNSGTNSQKNYFLEASYNQLTVNTTFYPPAQNNLVVSWQDSHPRAYYEPYNATTNPTGYNGDDERRNREFTLLQNAVAGVAAQVPSSLNIDSDGDGKVDNVVFLVSGAAGEWSSLLWPHRWAIYDRNVYLNNKRVYDFNLQLKDFLATRGVGVICHEFFHTLGAPDLYHYTSNGIDPAGSWDLMCSDQNPPQHMTAFMKWKYGNWIATIPTIFIGQQYTLNPLTSSTGNCYRIDSNNPNQYYVVEFRKKTGTFESSIPGSGMLIYRIDTTAGDGNASGPPDELYIYRPNGTTTVNGTINSANFSQETGRTSINNTTNPAPFLQDGSEGNLNIYAIGSSAGTTMTFSLGVPTVDFSTNPYTESFDSSTFPPTGWYKQTISGSYGFERVTSGTHPTCSPQAGAGMICYKSYNAPSSSSAILATLRLNCSEVQFYSYDFSFYMYRDTGKSSNADRILIYLADTPDMSGTNTLLGTINRYTGFTPTVPSNGWYQYSFNLPLTTSGYYYVVCQAISAKGNNMFLDSFSIKKTALPPSPAISPSPADLAENVSVSPIFSWANGGGYPSHYLFYLGTNNPPTNLIDGLNLGNVLNYTYTGTLNYSTQYYWKVIPVSEGGSAQNCSVWSFITYADPRITTLPYRENFDIVTAPTLPFGWETYISSSNSSAFVKNFSSPTNYALSPPNCINFNNITDTSAQLILITPEILTPINILRLKFYAKGSATGYSLQVGTMSSPNGTFTSLTTVNLTNTMQQYSVPFSNYNGTDRFIAIRHNLGGINRNIYLDNFYLEEELTNDLAISALQMNGLGVIGEPLQFSVSVLNNGIATQNSYSIQLLSNSAKTVLANLDVLEPLAPGQTAVHNLTWIPETEQTLSVYAQVTLISDGYTGNNTSIPSPISIGSYIPKIGTTDTGTKTNLLPLNFNQKNSISETIYLASELQMTAGIITAIAYHTNFVQDLSHQAVKIWMKNTPESNLSSGWLSFDEYVPVFDSFVDFPAGNNTIIIILQIPFPYNGNNLAIRVNRPFDNYNYNTSNHFYYTNSASNPGRSRYLSNSSVIYDPQNPSALGSLSNFIPVTGFSVTSYIPAVLAIPQLLIQKNQQGVLLNWNAVPGANLYRIYASSDPVVWSDIPYAECSQTSFLITNPPDKMFFKIVAVYQAP